jgi:hypothetical protein
MVNDALILEDKSVKDVHTPMAVLATAWTAVLAVVLFKIVLQEIFNYSVSEQLYYRTAMTIVTAGCLLTFIWRTIRPLRSFFMLFIVLSGTQWLVLTRVDKIPIYQAWLNSPSFSTYMLAEVSLNLIVTLSVILFLFILKKKREAFFLAVGDTSAPVEQVRWLGVKPGERWNKFGLIFAVYLSSGTLIFLVSAGQPSWGLMGRVLPYLPVVFLVAAVNAFNEEMTYKASFLAVLVDAVGKKQAVWLMSAYFGIFHFYGIPYGVIGVILAGFLGWLLGKSMLETRGLFWAWFLHFLQDVFIFAFMAIGFIRDAR